jgi:hypothetical protein
VVHPGHQLDPDDGQRDEIALLGHLRDVTMLADPVPDDARLAARSAPAHVRLDADLARLTGDSRRDVAVAGARGIERDPRRLTFTAGDAFVEIEVYGVSAGLRLVGQGTPAEVIAVEVRMLTDERTLTTDDLGRFHVEVPDGPVSLVCTWPNQRTIETPWVIR